jgi:GntR family transcriptional regulator, transcriptional repressor for pyruvate dehydrogenase complex
MPNGPVGRKSEAKVSVKVSERLAERLRAEIANGQFVPGEFLPPESVLMVRYSVGRPSMREALRILESDGLIRIVRGVNGGVEVLDLDVAALARRAGLYLQVKGADLADLRAARDFIDPGAIAMAAKRRDAADIARLRACVEATRVCRSGTEFGEVAADFVEGLLLASGNQTLALFALVIDRLLRQEFHRFTDDGGDWASGEKGEWFATEWSIVVDLIESGDSAAAVAAWTAHRKRTVPDLGTASEVGEPLVVYPKNGPTR